MGTLITIKINKLEDAIDKCDSAVKKLEEYSDDIYTKVQRKMNSYSGSWTTNLSTASTQISQKKSDLSKHADAISTYKSNITSVKNNAVSVDNAISNKINSLMGGFKRKYGIQEETGFFAALWALVPEGWKDFFRNIKAGWENMIADVKEWYRYDGGKEAVLLIAATFAFVAAAIGVALAFLATGPFIVVLAGVLSAIIGFATATVALGYASEAYSQAKNGNKIKASRSTYHSGKETFASMMRRMGNYEFANLIDVVDMVSSLISIGYTIYQFKKIITQKGVISRLKNAVKKGFKDFGKNLKKGFTDSFKNLTKFKDFKDKADLAKTLKAWKNITSGFSAALKGDWQKTGIDIGKFFLEGFEIKSVGRPTKQMEKWGVKSFKVDAGKMFSLVGDALKVADKGQTSFKHIFGTNDLSKFKYDNGDRISNMKLFGIELGTWGDLGDLTWEIGGKLQNYVIEHPETLIASIKPIGPVGLPMQSAMAFAGGM
ncbi:MAG: hypothetical protein IKT57_01040 [Clostridia bacterium]|nr:hypothetical protein [Clostridia bacterium]